MIDMDSGLEAAQITDNVIRMEKPNRIISVCRMRRFTQVNFKSRAEAVLIPYIGITAKNCARSRTVMYL